MNVGAGRDCTYGPCRRTCHKRSGALTGAWSTNRRAIRKPRQPGPGRCCRLRNNLPADNGGFGLPSVTEHLHNGHTPLESDGFPCFFMERGQFYDHHYPNVYAGINSTHPGTGDIKEAMHTLWYHDHRIDHTAENTYKGLAGAYILQRIRHWQRKHRLPSAELRRRTKPLTSFDIYMVSTIRSSITRPVC